MSTEAIWNRRCYYCCCRCDRRRCRRRRPSFGLAIVCSFFKFIYTICVVVVGGGGGGMNCAYRRRHIKHLKIYDVHKQTASSNNKRWFTLCKSFWRLVFGIAYSHQEDEQRTSSEHTLECVWTNQNAGIDEWAKWLAGRSFFFRFWFLLGKV